MNTANETPIPADTASLRQTMVDCQLRTFDVTDHAVLTRMAQVPREAFLPDTLLPLAYSDRAIEIESDGARRQLLAPMVLARLLQAAAIKSGDRILSIGGGSGYGAAIAAGLGAQVIALEETAHMAALAQASCERAGAANVTSRSGPLSAGVLGDAPFDVILIEGAFESKPDALLGQLAQDGRLLAIERLGGAAEAGAGRAVCYRKNDGITGCSLLFSCAGNVLPGFAAVRAFSF
jgi:protein-L-isoaspartate(D-aspartate) O-methyltransferase